MITNLPPTPLLTSSTEHYTQSSSELRHSHRIQNWIDKGVCIIKNNQDIIKMLNNFLGERTEHIGGEKKETYLLQMVATSLEIRELQ